MSIRVVIFDLDGTLVQTERLKAQSYAQAAVQLRPDALTEDKVIDAFKDVVGLSRQEVAEALMERFDLADEARQHMDAFDVDTPWEAFVALRLTYYDDLLSDPDVLRNNQWEHNVDLLRTARQTGCYTALATMSHREQAHHVVDVLELADMFDFIATRDDVQKGKPDPEIYHLVRDQFDAQPEMMLVIEDSPSGVQAALSAGMKVVAVATPFTRDKLPQIVGLEPQHIVNDPADLIGVIKQFAGVVS